MSKIRADIQLNNGEWISFDKSLIKNLKVHTQSNVDNSSIAYGFVGQDGTVELFDKNSILASYIKDGLLNSSNVKVKIFINNKQKYSMISNGAKYNQDSTIPILTINLTGYLSYISELQYPKKQVSQSCNAFQLLSDILSFAGFSENEIDSMCDANVTRATIGQDIITIKELLESYYITLPYLETGSIIEEINKVCELAQLQLTQDDSGNLKFIDGTARIPSETNIINIPLNNQYSSNKFPLFTDNKFTSINTRLLELSPKTLELYNSEPIYANTYEGVGEVTDVFGEDGYTFDNIQYGLVTNAYYTNGDILFPDDYCRISIDNIEISPDNYIVDSTKQTLTLSILSNSSTKDIDSSGSVTGFENGISTRVSATIDLTQPKGHIVLTKGFETRTDNGDDKADNILYRNFSAVEAVYYYKIIWEIKDSYINLHLFFPKVAYFTGAINKGSKDWFLQNFTLSLTRAGFESKNVNTNEEKTAFQYTSNELINSSTFASNVTISNVIENNILADYSDGLISTNIDVSLADYYDINGNLVKRYSDGQMLWIGDVIKIQNKSDPNILFKITGTTFSYNGRPLLNLEVLQGVYVPSEQNLTFNLTKCSVQITRESSLKDGAELGQIDMDSEIYSGDVLRFNIESITGNNDDIQSIKINDENYVNNSEYTVGGDVSLIAVAYSWEDAKPTYQIQLDLNYSTDIDNCTFEQVFEYGELLAGHPIRITGVLDADGPSGYSDPFVNFSRYATDSTGWGDSLYSVLDFRTPEGEHEEGRFALRTPKEPNRIIYENYNPISKQSAVYVYKLIIIELQQYR